MTRRVLLLAGTREARELGDLLAGEQGWSATASLAGATNTPAELPIDTRVGGFGGVDGLADYLTEHRIDAVIDATHPFAGGMSANAVDACTAHRVPLLRVERPVWVRPAGARWARVASLEAAAAALPAGARAFLTVGSNSLKPFAPRNDVWFLVRTMEPQCETCLVDCKLVVGAPPRDSASEARLMEEHRITHLVTKNAGGSAYAKIEAAADLGIPTIIIERPVLPAAQTVDNVADALTWLRGIS